MLNKLGKIVSSRYKFSKGQEETSSILEGIKEVRIQHNIGDLKYLSLDNPLGDGIPFYNVFPELTKGTTSYIETGSLPMMHIPSENIVFFTNAPSLDHYILSNLEKLNNTNLKYGLDTEWERDSQELTILSLSFNNMPILVISLYLIKELPNSVKDLLSRNDLIACGRNVGLDCSKIYSQHRIMIKNRIELGTLAILHDNTLQNVKGGTTVANLTEKYLRMRLPVEKCIGQNASFCP